MTTTTIDALMSAYDRRAATRAELRQSGWRALRLARTLGYEVEKCRESGYYRLWMPSRVDAPVLTAAGWTADPDGPVYWLEGR